MGPPRLPTDAREALSRRSVCQNNPMKALAVLACFSLFACSADATDGGGGPGPAPVVTHGGENSPDPGPAAPAAKEDGRRARATGAFDLGLPTPAPTSFVCRVGAFCDDFEDVSEQPIGARWSDVALSGKSKLEAVGESASTGRGAVSFMTPDASSSVFLDRSGGGAASHWSGLVAFALRAQATPSAQLGGPELLVRSPDGAISVRVSLHREGLVLEQRAPDACPRDRCLPTTTVIAPVKTNTWYRVRLGFEVNAQGAAPYGRLEATVDDGPMLETDLNVPLYDGKIALHAGITQGDSKPAVASLDDVTFLVR